MCIVYGVSGALDLSLDFLLLINLLALMAECLIALIVLRSLVWSFLPCAVSLLPSLAEACAYISSVMLSC